MSQMNILWQLCFFNYLRENVLGNRPVYPHQIKLEHEEKYSKPCQRCQKGTHIHDIVFFSLNNSKLNLEISLELKFVKELLTESKFVEFECDVYHSSKSKNGLCVIIIFGGGHLMNHDFRDRLKSLGSKEKVRVEFIDVGI
ncbi:hypothetical protein N9N11_00955 [Candidatus Poseidoniales archaeon]|nr:hypothetical protein [Candidatus Poseidoniales archaeon]